MHSSMAKTRYGLHVQISEPNTSEPLPVHHIGEPSLKLDTGIRDTDIHRGHERSIPSIRHEQRRGCRLDRVPEHLLRGHRAEVRGTRTNVNGKVTDRWEKNLDIWTGNEFRVHSSSIFKESSA